MASEPIIQLVAPGECVANCTKAKCPRGMQPITEFLPAVSNKTHRKRAAMQKILAKLGELLDDPDCAALLEELGVVRTKTCKTCRLIRKKTEENPDSKKGACKRKWYELKEQLEEMGCVECGWNGIDAMTLEHTDPSKKKRDKNGDPVCLGDYIKWTTLGGPAAMQAEFDMESTVPMCLNCQFMAPTHNAMKPKLDPDTLPTVRPTDDPVAYEKKRKLTELRKKQKYVDDKKLAVGGCAECWMTVVPFGSEYTPGHSAYPHAFQMAHRSELDKERCVGKIVHDSRSFKTAKPELDLEMARSRLLCQNCGHVETQERKNAPGPSEEGN